MKRILFSLFFGLAPFLNPVSAGVISRDWNNPGDGLLTYDDVNQREWLDLTETQLFKFPGDTLQEQYAEVLAETMAGGVFAEFTVANSADVFALGESAGIEVSTIDFGANMAAADIATTLLGDVYSSVGSASNRNSVGHVLDQDFSNVISVFFRPNARETPAAGIRIESISSDLNGVWLYRQVPEPSGIILALGSVCGAMSRLVR